MKFLARRIVSVVLTFLLLNLSEVAAGLAKYGEETKSVGWMFMGYWLMVVFFVAGIAFLVATFVPAGRSFGVGGMTLLIGLPMPILGYAFVFAADAGQFGEGRYVALAGAMIVMAIAGGAMFYSATRLAKKFFPTKEERDKKEAEEKAKADKKAEVKAEAKPSAEKAKAEAA